MEMLLAFDCTPIATMYQTPAQHCTACCVVASKCYITVEAFMLQQYSANMETWRLLFWDRKESTFEMASKQTTKWQSLRWRKQDGERTWRHVRGRKWTVDVSEITGCRRVEGSLQCLLSSDVDNNELTYLCWDHHDANANQMRREGRTALRQLFVICTASGVVIAKNSLLSMQDAAVSALPKSGRKGYETTEIGEDDM